MSSIGAKKQALDFQHVRLAAVDRTLLAMNPGICASVAPTACGMANLSTPTNSSNKRYGKRPLHPRLGHFAAERDQVSSRPRQITFDVRSSKCQQKPSRAVRRDIRLDSPWSWPEK